MVRGELGRLREQPGRAGEVTRIDAEASEVEAALTERFGVTVHARDVARRLQRVGGNRRAELPERPATVDLGATGEACRVLRSDLGLQSRRTREDVERLARETGVVHAHLLDVQRCERHRQRHRPVAVGEIAFGLVDVTAVEMRE